MPQAVKLFKGSLTASTSATTLYTCPSSTIAQVRLNITARFQSSNRFFFLRANGSGTPSSSNFNYCVNPASSSGSRNDWIYWNDTYGHVYGGQSNSTFYPYADSTGTTSDFDNTYTRSFTNTPLDTGNSYVYFDKHAPALYMSASETLQIASDNNGGANLLYSIMIIEEPTS